MEKIGNAFLCEEFLLNQMHTSSLSSAYPQCAWGGALTNAESSHINLLVRYTTLSFMTGTFFLLCYLELCKSWNQMEQTETAI